jgi:hypothetical protein
VTLILTNAVSTPGENDLIQITVGTQYNPNATVPTGNVSVFVDGAVVDPSLALSTNPGINMTGLYQLVTPATTGSHVINVTYPGDATHAPSTATTVVSVGNGLASGGLSLAAGNLTIANGATGNTQITVTPNAGYNGRVVWSLAFSGASPTLTTCYRIPSLPVNNVSTTQLTIGIGAACSSPLPNERGAYRPLGHLASASDEAPAHRRRTPPTAVYASLLLCGLLAGWRRRTHLPLLLVIVILTVAGAGLTGCGGGGNTGTSATTPSTNYSIILTGTDSVNASITASTAFTLTVN